MNAEEQAHYKAWLKRVTSELPDYVTCPECHGSTSMDCPHCGHETDCDECDGNGTVRVEDVLTESFYRSVMAVEKAQLEHWISGDGIKTHGHGARATVDRNPLDELVAAHRDTARQNIKRLVLRLPLSDK